MANPERIAWLLIAIWPLAWIVCVQAAEGPEPPSKLQYPPSRTQAISDTLHGVEVNDPYRWLEEAESQEVKDWVAHQNNLTRGVLDRLPGRPAIHRRLNELLAIGTISTPSVRSNRYFYTRREGDQNQPILYVRDGLKGSDRVLVDPNSLSKDGTVALDWYYPSQDGKRLAYGVSESGSEQSTLRVLDVESGTHLADIIPFTRACSVAWEPDGDGFYYTRYPKPGTVSEGEENYHRHVFHHRIGQDPVSDRPVFGAGRHAQDWPSVDLSPDGRWLLVIESQGWAKSEVYLRDLSRPGSPFVPVVEGVDALFEGNIQNDRLYIHTNLESPRYRVYAVDPARPERGRWRELISERDAVLTEVAVIGGRLFAHYLRDATSRLELFSLEGESQGEVPLPTLGTLSGLGGEWNGTEAFYGFTSFALPPAIYRLELRNQAAGGKEQSARPTTDQAAAPVSPQTRPGAETPRGTEANPRAELWEKVQSSVDPDRYNIEQVRYRSKDGTEIPMFILSRRGLTKDGNNPTVLYGYGGFNINLTPSFSGTLPLWLEQGGVYAVANLRGGGEYGESWHQAGMLGKKQNVFDDYVAAGEWLIDQKYTRRDRLAIMGGSNGGLLVGAALTQRPELFRAVVCRVPLLDMVRYHQFRIAKLWIPEYGSADDPEQFRWLYAYSPYHRVREGTEYPAVLLTTAESDSRVDPMHALKMAARLQSASGSNRPILLRVESKAGHGAGKPLSKTIDEQTDIWSFLCWQLAVEYKS